MGYVCRFHRAWRHADLKLRLLLPTIDALLHLATWQPPVAIYHELQGTSGFLLTHDLLLNKGINNPKRAVYFSLFFFCCRTQRGIARNEDAAFAVGNDQRGQVGSGWT